MLGHYGKYFNGWSCPLLHSDQKGGHKLITFAFNRKAENEESASSGYQIDDNQSWLKEHGLTKIMHIKRLMVLKMSIRLLTIKNQPLSFLTKSEI